MKNIKTFGLAVFLALVFLSPKGVQAHSGEREIAKPTDSVGGTDKPSLVATQTNDIQTPPSAPAPEKKEYVLPYPGLLPDSPLYWLKGIRDRIYETLVTDSARKLELNIKQADKRLVMGVALSEKGKTELMEDTVSKGTKYMDAAVTIYVKAKGTDKPMPGYLEERLKASLGKHIEVVTDLSSRNPGLKGSLDLLKELEAKVK